MARLYLFLGKDDTEKNLQSCSTLQHRSLVLVLLINGYKMQKWSSNLTLSII
jgi:hypothetical protein